LRTADLPPYVCTTIKSKSYTAPCVKAHVDCRRFIAGGLFANGRSAFEVMLLHYPTRQAERHESLTTDYRRLIDRQKLREHHKVPESNLIYKFTY